jgi:hypothetical protein
MLFVVAVASNAQNSTAGSAATAPSVRANTPPGKSGSKARNVPGDHKGKQATDPVAPPVITITGKGDHTGTGAGTGGIHSYSLSIPQIPNAFGITQGTVLRVRLHQPISSALAHNGDMADGVLTDAAGSAPAGSPVKLTIVAASAAGQMSSAGELSLQVVSINGETVLSNVITVLGEMGKTYLADDEPDRGTEASITPENAIELPAA